MPGLPADGIDSTNIKASPETDTAVASLPETFTSSALSDGSQPAFFSPDQAPNWNFDAFGPETTFGFPQQTWDLPVQLNPNQAAQQQQHPHAFRQASALPDNSALFAAPSSRHPPVTLAPNENFVRPVVTSDVMNSLTPAQQEKLKSIAMPPHLLNQLHSPKGAGSPESNSSGKGFGSSPEPAGQSKGQNRKRKSSAEAEDDDDDDDDGDAQQPKKTTHNMIEKRYRTNLNDKIAALRDSVPALRIMSKSARGEDTTEDREELHGLTPAHKLNKATVLSKATEYIRHLEKRNTRLSDENRNMQARIAAFEKLFMAGAMGGIGSPMGQQPPTPMQFAQDSPAFMTTPLPTPGGPDPPGMIPVPDDMKRILTTQQLNAGRPYPVPNQPYQAAAIVRQQQLQQQQAQAGRWNPYFGKLMVGSLAGLMLVEAFVEREQSNETPEGRGLFAVPLQMLSSFVRSAHLSAGGYHISGAQLLVYARSLLILGALLWVFVPSIFVPSPPKSQKERIHTSLKAVPSLASPIHVRRQAWLTAIQTVWVPRHNFFLEAAALLLKTLKYAARTLISVRAFEMLTGLTKEQEIARVKAWAIALDAQLAGGDVEINKSRLTLTLLASGTLPDTPYRLMLKALHIRIILWQLNFASPLTNMLAKKLARSRWNAAKQLVRLNAGLDKSEAKPDEELPDHLAILLEQDCDEVLNDYIIQRAHNLAWNQLTTHNVTTEIDGMNAVVEDPAVRSPMDAVAAWCSSILLQRVVTGTLSDEDLKSGFPKDLEEDLILAVNLAPIGSNAQVRALVARAALLAETRGSNIADAICAMDPSMNPDKHPEYREGVPPLIDSPTTLICPDSDVQMALCCAKSIAHLEKFAVPPPSIFHVIDSILPSRDVSDMSLLGCMAAFRLMIYIHDHPFGKEVSLESLERLAGTLRIWIGSAAGDKTGLSEETRQTMVDKCLSVSKSVVGMDTSDPGYGSMSDCEEATGGC
ncbi:hypothetical protein GQ53DRAFT_661541 [Thozetella sp. PMI_491]|nr:hypothetical protein GQ53DRAFT_661541 [Thozetella sp. PMI_491]